MTYCVALRLDAGMIFASDSRTNAGVDHVSTFAKMRVFERKDDRVIVVLSSGNLAITQGVVNLLDRHKHAAEGTPTIWNVDSMYDAASLVGDALRDMQQKDGPYLLQRNIDANGKPILDRVITTGTPQKEAAKCVLISFDSTMKSNISVGLPIDLLWLPRDSLRVGLQQRIREGDPYFTMLRSRWGGGLRRVFGELPDPDWLE